MGFIFFQNLYSSSLAFLCTCPNCCKSNCINFSSYFLFTYISFPFFLPFTLEFQCIFLQVLCICWNSLCVKVKVMQSCLTLCYLMDCRMPGSSVHGILQTRILERVGFPSPGNLPQTGIKLRSPSLQDDSLPSEPPGKPWNSVFNSNFV